MKPIRCTNCKSFFDSDKYDTCPHCNTSCNEPANALISQHPVPNNPTESKGFQFGKKLTGFSKKKSSTCQDIYSSSASDALNVSPSIEKISKAAPGGSSVEPVSEMSNEIDCELLKNEPVSGFVKESTSLSKAIAETESTTPIIDNKTIAFYGTNASAEPVVGWLVCIKGEYFGESFCIHSGRNLIGRSLNMDIALAKDGRVSRDTHSVIVFEPIKKNFFIEPGKGSGLTYLNDELLMTYKSLSDKDEISLGASRFLFVPLCGEAFDWDRHIESC